MTIKPVTVSDTLVKNVVEVTKKQFFEIINPLDVHPRPCGRCPEQDERSEWYMYGGSGKLIGMSFSGHSYLGTSSRYFLIIEQFKRLTTV